MVPFRVWFLCLFMLPHASSFIFFFGDEDMR